MAEEPLFSVIIPTYNCASYIAQAVDSVLAQSIPPAQREVIVIDDGSTDGTAAVLERFGAQIQYVYQTNAGVASARNAGIAHARGNYIAFLDADDYWFPKRLEYALALLRSEARIFVNSELYVERGGVRDPAPYYRSRGQKSLFTLDAPAQLEFAVEGNFISAMVVLPRAALEQVGDFDTHYRYGEDWHLWLRLLEAGWAVRLIDEPCGVYRLERPGATTSRHDFGMACDRLRVLQKYPSFVSSYRREVSQGLVDHYGFRDALARAAWSRVMRHGFGLAKNWHYLRDLVGTRLSHRA